MTKPVSLLITCEHGGNRIPPRYRHLFHGHEELLQTHRGHDAGGLTMAKELAGAFKATLFVATISRLLIDLNRSVGHLRPTPRRRVMRPSERAANPGSPLPALPQPGRGPHRQ